MNKKLLFTLAAMLITGIVFSQGHIEANTVQGEEGNIYHLGGNIGIGTDSPQDLLHIYSFKPVLKLESGNIKPKKGPGPSFTDSWEIMCDENLEFSYFGETATQGPEIVFSSGGIITATRFVGDGSELTGVQGLWNQRGDDIYYDEGNVGIGTYDVMAKLHVAGDFYVADDGIFEDNVRIWDNLSIGTNSTSALLTLNSKAGGKDVGITQNLLGGVSTLELTTSDGTDQTSRMVIRGNTANADIEFYRGSKNNEALSMLIEGSNGNVGIGVNNPTSKLDVAGRIRAEEVLILLESWKDEVFEANYKLLSLEEVDQFIKDNGHLPEIPSEEEMITNGLETKEMIKLQMQKIEELTLYTIEQQKLIEELQKEISNLKNK